MDEKLEAVTVEAVAALKQAGALFGYLQRQPRHGPESR